MSYIEFDFGRYKGRMLSEADSDFLAWCVIDAKYLKSYQREGCYDELLRRGENPYTYRRQNARRLAPAPAFHFDPTQRHIAHGIIGDGRRRMAARHHPDRGGNPEMMREINVVADKLEKLIG